MAIFVEMEEVYVVLSKRSCQEEDLVCSYSVVVENKVGVLQEYNYVVFELVDLYGQDPDRWPKLSV